MNTQQIGTSIQPGQLYSSRNISQSRNQAVANQHQNSLTGMLGSYSRPGISRQSPATIARAIPQFAQSQAQAMQQKFDVPMQMQLANASFNRQGQAMRENQALNQGQSMQSLSDMLRGYQFNTAANPINFFMNY